MRARSGFTLIELLVVIAIIGVLSTLGIFGFQSAMSKARDAQRRSDLHNLSIALEQYHSDTGSYPSTAGVAGCVSGWCGEPSGYGSHATDYIPNLAPRYIKALPNDPRAGVANPINDSSICPLPAQTGYIYNSNGTDFKLLAHCTPEGQLNNPKDPYYDPHPARHAYAWAVYSENASQW